MLYFLSKFVGFFRKSEFSVRKKVILCNLVIHMLSIFFLALPPPGLPGGTESARTSEPLRPGVSPPSGSPALPAGPLAPVWTVRVRAQQHFLPEPVC
jgi:hypothetical protein